MIIKKYLAKTEKDAIEKAKEELGAQAIVMNVKKVHPRGIMRIFLRAKVEVTAALDDNTSYDPEVARREAREKKEALRAASGGSPGSGSAFDVSIPPIDKVPPIDEKSTKSDNNEKQTNEERLSQLFSLLEKQMEEKANKPASEPSKTTEEKPVKKEAKKEIKTERSVLQETVNKKEKTEEKKETKKPEPSTETDDEKPDTEEEKAAVYRELIYKQLIENEVDPEIADSILDEAKRSLPKDAKVDQILGSVYQRIILMIGQPYTINFKPNEATKFVFFLGSTGVGKTTTIAKIASKLKLEQNCNLALVTADTYRIAAVEQLKVYADILSVPLNVVYDPSELADMMDELSKYDLVLVDTAGCSHKNKEQIENVKMLLEQVPISKRMVYLALSIVTNYKDLKEIAKVYSEMTDYSIIFTKLDESSSAGVMLNIKTATKCPLSYLTNGQNVPDDIEKVDAQTLAKQLMS